MRAAYRPISKYGLTGDALTGALMARDGSIEWLCLPNFDDASWFGALLDRERGGRFFVGAPGPARWRGGHLGLSAILRRRITTDEGVLQITDLMPLRWPGCRGSCPNAACCGS